MLRWTSAMLIGILLVGSAPEARSQEEAPPNQEDDARRAASRLAEIQQIMNRRPKDPQALRRQLETASKQLQQLIADLGSAPQAADAYILLSQAQMRLGNYEGVLATAGRFLQTNSAHPRAAEVQMGMALAFARLERFEEAIRTLEPVPARMQAAAQRASAFELLGDLQQQAGDVAKALRCMELAMGTNEDKRFRERVKQKWNDLKLVGAEAKPFELRDLEGKPFSLEAYRGKAILLDFWATWCDPCKKELPNVILLRETWKDKGFEVLGVSLDEDRAKLDAFLTERGLPWPQHFDGKGWKSDLAVLYEVRSLPRTLLIDREGKIRHVNLRGKALGARLEEMMEEDEAAAPAIPPQAPPDDEGQ